MAIPLLRISGITRHFGGLRALADVELAVGEREIHGLIGPNGSGKTTLLNCITGVHRPSAGRIEMTGQNVVGLPPHAITKLGIARTFQNIQLFANMTVLDNVRVGRHCRTRAELAGALLRPAWARREESDITTAAQATLDLLGLGEHAGAVARTLSYGQQRRLEIARALATGARVLLLDEPTCGMNPHEAEEMMQLIAQLRDRGLTIVLVEHNMKVVMGLCDHISVLDHGEKIAEGTPTEIQDNRRVIEAYLGTGRRPTPGGSAISNGRTLLEVDDIVAGYGAIRALKGVSLQVAEGEIVTLIGANGAGKSSTLRAISGLLRLEAGQVSVAGTRLAGRDPGAIVGMGVVQVPEGRGIFSDLTVRENLLIGGYLERTKSRRERRMQDVLVLFPKLRERERQLGGTLSGGEQQMLALARALMAGPRLLLLDEPSMGLAPLMVQATFDMIGRIHAEGTTVLLVEQNASMALGASNRAYVMETGRVVLEGKASDLGRNEQIKRAYLGA